MKRLIFTFLIFISWSGITFSQNSQETTLYVSSSKFTAPLLEKWVNEYAKINKQVKIKLVEQNKKDQKVDIELVTSGLPENTLSHNQFVSYVGRYALLPVANAGNTALTELNRKRLNNKRLKELFFEKDIFDDDQEPSKIEKEFHITIYSGNTAVSSAPVFASHFGRKASELKGKKILGDDIFLINAVQKDNTGITFNNLSYIYDIKTRQLKTNLALIPLDLKKEQREILAELNIDKTIELLETESVDIIPIEKIGLVYQNNNVEIKNFLKWILSEGQAYNHSYGFLNVDKTVLISQIKQIDEQYLTLK